MSSRSSLARRALGAAALLLAVAPALPAQARQLSIRWLGHAAFEVVSPGGTRILIDPFISGNPATPDSLKDMARYTGGATRPAAVLVTHSHDDHALDAKAIASRSGARLISAYEWVSAQQLPQAQAMGGNVGGRFVVGDVTVHLVPAMHSSEPGRALGFVLELADGRTIYHTGDTWLFGDMSLIQEMHRPSIILLGVGGGPYTQGPAAARRAIAKYFRPRTIIPMHYGTFPGLASEAEVRAAFAGERRLRVLVPGAEARF